MEGMVKFFFEYVYGNDPNIIFVENIPSTIKYITYNIKCTQVNIKNA